MKIIFEILIKFIICVVSSIIIIHFILAEKCSEFLSITIIVIVSTIICYLYDVLKRYIRKKMDFKKLFYGFVSL